MASAILRLKNPEKNHEWMVSTSVEGRHERKYEWNKKNNFQCEVPVEVKGKDSFGNPKVFHQNYAQQLLDSYPDMLELVENVDKPQVTQPKVRVKKVKETVKDESTTQ